MPGRSGESFVVGLAFFLGRGIAVTPCSRVGKGFRRGLMSVIQRESGHPDWPSAKGHPKTVVKCGAMP